MQIYIYIYYIAMYLYIPVQIFRKAINLSLIYTCELAANVVTVYTYSNQQRP